MIVRVVVIMRMVVRMVVVMRMVMTVMVMTVMVMMFRLGMDMSGVVGVIAFGVQAFCVQAVDVFPTFVRLSRQRRIGAGVLDDIALNPLATAAAALVAVARTAATAAGAILALFLGFAMGAFVGLDQGLTVGDRDLVIVGVDFAEGQEAVAVAAIFDEGGLQRRFYACHLGEVDIAAQLFALGSLEIKFLDAIAADHNDPGLFRVGSIDQHFVGHFATHDGGGRV